MVIYISYVKYVFPLNLRKDSSFSRIAILFFLLPFSFTIPMISKKINRKVKIHVLVNQGESNLGISEILKLLNALLLIKTSKFCLRYFASLMLLTKHAFQAEVLRVLNHRFSQHFLPAADENWIIYNQNTFSTF